MHEALHIFPVKVRWTIIGVVILLATLLAVSILVPTPKTTASAQPSKTTHTNTDSSSSLNSYDDTNAVTAGMAAAADQLNSSVDAASKTLGNSGQSLSNGGKTIGAALARGGSATTHGLGAGATAVGHGLSIGATVTARVISGSFAVATYIPRTALGFAADTAIVSAIIEPAKNSPVPTIDTSLPAKITAQATLPDAKPAGHLTPLTDTEAAWPIHGTVTTLFGVPELPYQAVHTGLDISDGNWAGTTAVMPFKPGHVVQVVHSSLGLGNHIVVDHGGGVTSVYGHLYATSVVEGQQVDKETVLGFEGNTGASTGAHLHFEIRVNGEAMDPHQFITGQP